MRTLARVISLPLLATFAWFASAASAVTIDWVTVGDPGNPCDVQPEGCFGSVAYTYRISKYEITNAQYAEFLNAVAADDPNWLYDPRMAGAPGAQPLGESGITQTGASGTFSYSVSSGFANKPVTHITIDQASRFANWLHNGQPTGAQGSTTTEDGAYTFTGLFSVGTRNPGATIFVTSEDEWYKAAYYDAASMSYFDYPTGTNTPPVCAAPTATPNRANCQWALEAVTDVGAYPGSASPYGTFDQGGNVYEWNESIIFLESAEQGIRGGGFRGPLVLLAASSRDHDFPRDGDNDGGFRVASLVPEPGTGLLVMAGLLGIVAWRRGGDLACRASQPSTATARVEELHARGR